jgi:hypothetical protein
MPETANYLHLARRPRVATRRKLTWVEEPRFQGLRLLRMYMGVQAFGATRRQLARGNEGELRAAARQRICRSCLR